jgi:hypothetical protein
VGCNLFLHMGLAKLYSICRLNLVGTAAIRADGLMQLNSPCSWNNMSRWYAETGYKDALRTIGNENTCGWLETGNVSQLESVSLASEMRTFRTTH